MIKGKLGLFFTIIGISLSIGCYDTNEEEEVNIIEGKYAYSDFYQLNIHTIFVEDSLAGKEFSHIYIDRTSDLLNYEVEAYRLLVTDDTIFINEETGEEISLGKDGNRELFEYPNQRIEATVAADFERVWTEADKHISYAQQFLPVVEAKRITIHPYTKEDFIGFRKPVADNHFIFMVLDKNVDSYYASFMQQFIEEVGDRTDIDIFSQYISYEHYFEFFNVKELPKFIILSNEGKILRTDSIEETHRFLQTLTGIDMELGS